MKSSQPQQSQNSYDLPSSSSSFFSTLWQEIDPVNPLRKAFFISNSSLVYFRYFAVIFNTIPLVWTIATTPNEYTPHHFALMAYLTIWGFVICYTYSILTIVWANADNDSWKWRITYILGEVGFALQLMICPFYFIVMFPLMLKYLNLTSWDIIYQVLMHLGVPLVTWLGVIFSDIAFPKSHKIIVQIVVGAYLLNNLTWTMALGRPIYLPVDWVTMQSYILKALASLTVVGGFMLGGRIYEWKQRKTFYCYDALKLV